MNHNQKKYALERIDALKSIKLRDAEVKYTSKEVKLSNEQAYNLIASGKVKLKKFDIVHKGYGSPYLYPSFDFSEHECCSKLDKTNYDPIFKSVCKISQDAKDQIMLGDCEEALKLIKKLEDIKV